MADVATTSRGDGSTITVAETVAGLPASPFLGLRVGDFGLVLTTPPQLYQLQPAAAITTLAAFQAGGPATLRWAPAAGGSVGSFTVATLPAGVTGQTAYATNGRKVGEGGGAGTGVPVYFSTGAWRVYSTDAAVAA
jgi:hypothetical protein